MHPHLACLFGPDHPDVAVTLNNLAACRENYTNAVQHGP